MELDLDKLETGSFCGRTHGGVFYKVGDKWAFAYGDRDSAQAFATLLDPIGHHRWVAMLEMRSRQDGYCWSPTVGEIDELQERLLGSTCRASSRSRLGKCRRPGGIRA